MLGSAETPPRAPPTGARVAIQAIRWSLDGERANDDDRDAVSDTASVVPYRISAKHLVTLYWISPISTSVDYLFPITGSDVVAETADLASE